MRRVWPLRGRAMHHSQWTGGRLRPLFDVDPLSQPAVGQPVDVLPRVTKHMDDRRVYVLGGHGYHQRTRGGHDGTPRLVVRRLTVDRVQPATGR